MIITSQYTVEEYREKHPSPANASAIGDFEPKTTWSNNFGHCDGIRFSHGDHAVQYSQLGKWFSTGVIYNLVLTPNILLLPTFRGNKAVMYQPMFMYNESGSGQVCVADRVGSNFYFWNLKRKLFEYYNQEVSFIPYGADAWKVRDGR